MNCSKCGTSLPAGAAFCPVCGHPAVSFTPPEPEPAPPAVIPKVRYAGFWLRFLASLLDMFLLSVVLNPLFFYLFLRAGIIKNPQDQPPDFSAMLAMMQQPETLRAALAVEAIVFVIVGIYFSLMESSPLQATLGKRILGLKVTDLEGRRISLGRATARYFAKMFSNLTFMIGYVIAGFTEHKQALHDILSQCLVVRR
jgi:uncharacterized RDD family membrane protein YckC